MIKIEKNNVFRDIADNFGIYYYMEMEDFFVGCVDSKICIKYYWKDKDMQIEWYLGEFNLDKWNECLQIFIDDNAKCYFMTSNILMFLTLLSNDKCEISFSVDDTGRDSSFTLIMPKDNAKMLIEKIIDAIKNMNENMNK